jgi:hypothetical protein
VFEVKGCLEGLDVLGGVVRVGQVIGEEPGLEERVLNLLAVLI